MRLGYSSRVAGPLRANHTGNLHGISAFPSAARTTVRLSKE
jgi:hypothetical protein